MQNANGDLATLQPGRVEGENPNGSILGLCQLRSHPILNVVIQNVIQLFLGEAVMLGEDSVNLVKD